MTKAAIQELDWDILPHPPYSPNLTPSDYLLFRSLSNNLCGVSFNKHAEHKNWLNEFFTAKPADYFKCGTENLPERWEAVENNGAEYMIDCLIIRVKNKLFGSIKRPHELTHQPNTMLNYVLYKTFQYIFACLLNKFTPCLNIMLLEVSIGWWTGPNLLFCNYHVCLELSLHSGISVQRKFKIRMCRYFGHIFSHLSCSKNKKKKPSFTVSLINSGSEH
jgi:hypothetical protein